MGGWPKYLNKISDKSEQGPRLAGAQTIYRSWLYHVHDIEHLIWELKDLSWMEDRAYVFCTASKCRSSGCCASFRMSLGRQAFKWNRILKSKNFPRNNPLEKPIKFLISKQLLKSSMIGILSGNLEILRDLPSSSLGLIVNSTRVCWIKNTHRAFLPIVTGNWW